LGGAAPWWRRSVPGVAPWWCDGRRPCRAGCDAAVASTPSATMVGGGCFSLAVPVCCRRWRGPRATAAFGFGDRCACRPGASLGGGDDDSDSRLPRRLVECYDGDVSSPAAVARWCRPAKADGGSGVHCSGRKPLPESFWWIGGGALGRRSPC
jgi:hypothetical protein